MLRKNFAIFASALMLGSHGHHGRFHVYPFSFSHFKQCRVGRYLGKNAWQWYRQFILTDEGKRKPNGIWQKNPVQYRSIVCKGHVLFKRHGPEYWHARFVILSIRMRETARKRAVQVTVGVRAAHVALHEVGVPYVWGGTTPTGFDCSGLVRYAYSRVGVYLPRTTWDQMNVGRRVTLSAARVGDILFFDGGSHEGMYLGHGRYIQAPYTGTVVQVSSLYPGTVYAVRRPS